PDLEGLLQVAHADERLARRWFGARPRRGGSTVRLWRELHGVGGLVSGPGASARATRLLPDLAHPSSSVSRGARTGAAGRLPSTGSYGPSVPVEYSCSLCWILRGLMPRMVAAFEVEPLQASSVFRIAYRSRS